MKHIERRVLLIVIAAVFVYVAVLGSVSSMRHFNFQTQAWDMGIFVQTFWNTAHGMMTTNTIEEIPNHLGVHMSPIIFVLLPGFLIFQSAYFLLIAQTLALALGAIPLYLFAKKFLGRRDFALVLALGYLFYPSLHRVNLFDFHPIAFLVPLLIGAFYFFYEKKWIWFWVFMILAAFVQEDAVLAVIFSGLFLAFVNWKETKERKIALYVSASAFIYFIVSIKILMPYFGGGLLRIDRYAELGGSFSEIIQNLFFNPFLFFKIAFSASKLAYLFWLFLPVLFLPFFRPSALFLLAPGLLENLLTSFENQFSGFYQYDSMLIAGLFIASVYGLKNLFDYLPTRTAWFKWILIIAVFAVFLFRSPVGPAFFPTDLFKRNENRQVLHEIVKSIPDSASVSANTNIVPHLAKREHIYMLGYEPTSVDAVIIDGADMFGFESPEALQQYADSYAFSGAYDIQVFKARYIVFTKK